MNIKQIGLIVLGAILIVLLSFLPKNMVSNNDRLSQTEANVPTKTELKGQEADNVAADSHMATIVSEADLKTIDSLRSIYHTTQVAAANHQKAHEVLDQLVSQFRRLNLFDSAALYLEQEARQNPSVSHYLSAADAYYEASLFAMKADKAKNLANKARTYYEYVLKEEPTNNNAKAQLAMTYVTTSNPMQGVQMLKEILETDPNHILAIQNLGLLSLQSKQYGKAVERFEKLVKLQPNDASAHFYLGVSYKELGAKDEAKQHLEFVFQHATDPALKNAAQEYLKGL